jgi:catechol 2,3-dioxygenase-like lactoylglutathione lyase family enzyme
MDASASGAILAAMPLDVAAHHLSFPVTNLERSRAFYENVLGLRPIPRPDFGFPGVWYQAGPCEVHLIQSVAGVDLGAPPPSLNPMAQHAAFAVRDYDQTLSTLKGHGLEVLETSAQQGQMWVRDPDGHIIELIVARR